MNKILCVFGTYNYGDKSRGHSYEYQNFIDSFKSLGFITRHFDSRDKQKYENYIDLNEKLINEIIEFRPNVLFVVQNNFEIWNETYALIRDLGIHVYLWTTDDSWRYESFSRYIAQNANYITTTYSNKFEKYLNDGNNNVLLTQWAANSKNLLIPLKAPECYNDVTFIGTAYPHRIKMIESLKAAGVDVSCFGFGWTNGPIPADEIPQTVNSSKMILNFNDSVNNSPNQIKARIFEMTGMGSLLLTEVAPEIEKFYRPGKEIVLFNGANQLIEKVQYYLNNPFERDEIANKAFLRTQSDHLYEHRFNEIFKGKIDNTIERDKLQVDWEKFNQAKTKHSASVIIKALTFILVNLLVPILGKNKANRAVRRLVFKISIFIYKEKTYSSSGLPGILFYEYS